MNKKTRLLILLVAVALIAIGGILVGTVLILRNRDNWSSGQAEQDDSSTDNNIGENEDREEEDPYADYPELEPLIGLTLDEVKALYPGGEDIVANTTWGEQWYSYRYENDLFLLIVDGKATKVVDFAGLEVKALKGCEFNETVLTLVDTVVPYAHIDPAEIGTATNPGIYQGAPTFYNYKQGYAVGVMCTAELDGTSTLEVTYFTVPDYYHDS